MITLSIIHTLTLLHGFLERWKRPINRSLGAPLRLHGALDELLVLDVVADALEVLIVVRAPTAAAQTVELGGGGFEQHGRWARFCVILKHGLLGKREEQSSWLGQGKRMLEL